MPTRGPSDKVPIVGFHRVSLLSMLEATGHVPTSAVSQPESLDQIRTNSAGPVVVFPECTTSNGRGLLRFSDVFKRSIPVKDFQVFIMCVRYVSPVPPHRGLLNYTV